MASNQMVACRKCGGATDRFTDRLCWSCWHKEKVKPVSCRECGVATQASSDGLCRPCWHASLQTTQIYLAEKEHLDNCRLDAMDCPRCSGADRYELEEAMEDELFDEEERERERLRREP